MQKHEENLAANTSSALRPLSGASVVVTDIITGQLASLYSDNGSTPLFQPLTTNNDGYYGFFAPDGKYLLTFSGPRFATFTREIVLEDPQDNPYATLAQLAAGSGAMLVRHNNALVSDVLDDLTEAIASIGTGGGSGYTLPTASSTVLGGIKLGANLTVDPGGVVKAGLTNGAIVSALASSATAPRTHTFPDKAGTVAHLDDIPAPSAAGAMVLLGQATVSSAVAQVDFLNICSAAYDHYVIDVNGAANSVASALLMRAAVGGVVDSTSSIYTALAADGTVASNSDRINLTPALVTLGSSGGRGNFTVEVRNANSAEVKPIGVRGLYNKSDSSSLPYVVLGEGLYRGTTAISGFRFYWGAGNFTGGTIRIYGIKNS